MDTNSNAKWRLDLTWVELYEDFIDGKNSSGILDMYISIPWNLIS
jgi:hypothetical protein